MDAITQTTRGAKIMDIVKRLKAKPPKGFVTSPLMIEAADEIERLRQQNVELVEALEIAADGFRDCGAEDLEDMCRAVIAKATGGE